MIDGDCHPMVGSTLGGHERTTVRTPTLLNYEKGSLSGDVSLERRLTLVHRLQPNDHIPVYILLALMVQVG